MSRIPKIEEWLARYMMLFVIIMEPWETFIGRAMKWPNIQEKLSMMLVPLDIELEGWGDNANKVTPIDLQWRIQEGT